VLFYISDHLIFLSIHYIYIHTHTHTHTHSYTCMYECALEFITQDKSFWNYIQKMAYFLTTNQDGWVSHSSKCHCLYNEGIKENIFLCPISTHAKMTAICLLSPERVRTWKPSVTAVKYSRQDWNQVHPTNRVTAQIARPAPPITWHSNLSKIWSICGQHEIQHRMKNEYIFICTTLPVYFPILYVQ
jgi:hypothetical protein